MQQLEIKLVCGDAQLPCGVVVAAAARWRGCGGGGGGGSSSSSKLNPRGVDSVMFIDGAFCLLYLSQFRSRNEKLWNGLV